MKIVIVGGLGFIGQALVSRLLYLNTAKIYVLGRNIENRLHNLVQATNVEYVDFDLCMPFKLPIFGEIDYVYFLASGTYPASSAQSPAIDIHLNVLPFIKFMEQFLDSNKVSKFIFISSAGTVYGSASKLASGNSFKESDPTYPESPYGIFKKTMEDLSRYYSNIFKFELYIFRVSNVYGPNTAVQKDFGVVNIWVKNIINNHIITKFGSGDQSRDYIYIEDLINIISFAGLSIYIYPGIYNACSGVSNTLNELIVHLEQISPIPFKVVEKWNRGFDLDLVKISNEKLREVFPLKLLSLENGIFRTFEFYLKVFNP